MHNQPNDGTRPSVLQFIVGYPQRLPSICAGGPKTSASLCVITSSLFVTFAQADVQMKKVRIEGGFIEGNVSGEILSFKGIPYAAPPIRNYRWRACFESVQSHRSLDPMQSTRGSIRQQVFPHPPCAIGSIAAEEARSNLGAKLLIAAAAPAARPLQPSIEPTPRDTKRQAHPFHGLDPPALRNEGELHVDSFAK
jgi:hypothetical protein